LNEKGFAAALGLAVPRYAAVTDEATLADAIATVGAPAILKTARDGYDGKGQARVDNAADAAASWAELGHARAILEQRIAFIGEFSVIVARGRDGDMRHWPAPRNRHDHGILQRSECPAPEEWAGAIAIAIDQARAIADALGHVGVLAVEFFVTDDGPMFNEIAPRVHNSGHWTIEGAVTCQFENHIRAICGLPLGDTALRASPVVMRNLIGDDINTWPQLFADPACKLHLYGKGAPTPARKMGHATWVGASPQ
nr:ATP-grasp domain-containing protein [Sphingopyxis sp.]